MVKILKIGGSALTDKTQLETPRQSEIDRIACEISRQPQGLILIHGAGSFGHIHAREYGLRNRFDPQGILDTHKSVVKLNNLVVEALDQAGAHPVPIHPLSCTLLEKGRIVRMESENIHEMVTRGLLPVLHGDVAMDRSLGVDIISGDQLVTYLAKLLKPEVVALGTAVDGVMLDGTVVPKVTPKNQDLIEPHLGSSEGIDVTGGMRGKLLELLDLAKHGVKSLIFNASTEGHVERVIRGDHIGTLVEDCK